MANLRRLQEPNHRSVENPRRLHAVFMLETILEPLLEIMPVGTELEDIVELVTTVEVEGGLLAQRQSVKPFLMFLVQ